MQELAEKLNVPLESIDDQTRWLLENLTKQLGLVARQAGPLEDSSIPPELREPSADIPRTTIPPELRDQQHISTAPTNNTSTTSIPSQLRSQQTTIPLDHMGDNVDRRVAEPVHSLSGYGGNPTGDSGIAMHNKPRTVSMSSNDMSTDYCTSYPPPDMDDESSNRLANQPPTVVDYSHGKRGKDTVTSESILVSLQTDIAATNRSNGEPTRLSTHNSTSTPLQGKGQPFTQNSRADRDSGPNKAGNGFLPRQLHGRPNTFNGPRQAHPNPVRPNMGHRPSAPQHPQSGQSRKW